MIKSLQIEHKDAQTGAIMQHRRNICSVCPAFNKGDCNPVVHLEYGSGHSPRLCIENSGLLSTIPSKDCLLVEFGKRAKTQAILDYEKSGLFRLNKYTIDITPLSEVQIMGLRGVIQDIIEKSGIPTNPNTD